MPKVLCIKIHKYISLGKSYNFRPCAMVVPDFELICEIMLVAEGFLDARLLARKFITLYSLCKELLSKQVNLLSFCVYIPEKVLL